jgi:ribosome-associated toxin RatA of RatAB toxin-antitoxin module
MDVRKTVLVGHSAERMFDLIEACEHYPDFLPWCSSARVVARDDDTVVADITINYHGVHFDFRTRNPKKRPTWMAIHLERGPFRRFEGVWGLTPLAADGCRIDFGLHYDIDSTAIARIARPVLDRMANTLVDRFVARADQLGAAGAPSAPDTTMVIAARQQPAAPAFAPAESPAPARPDPRPFPDRNDPVNRSDPS